ncbi:hypothetical protein DXG03_006619, partial [Asterophora parasitica]
HKANIADTATCSSDPPSSPEPEEYGIDTSNTEMPKGDGEDPSSSPEDGSGQPPDDDPRKNGESGWRGGVLARWAR